MIICLMLEEHSNSFSDQPETAPPLAGQTGSPCGFLFDLAPDGVCLATGHLPFFQRLSFCPIRWSLTPPFHPYHLRLWRKDGLFLWHFPFSPFNRETSRHYIGTPYPMESGLSSPCFLTTRSDHPPTPFAIDLTYSSKLRSG